MTVKWAQPRSDEQPAVDVDFIEDATLAMAQSTIQNAIDAADISRAELARRMGIARSFVTRMLQGDHNLTVRTLGRALGACGFQVGFEALPLRWARNSEPVVFQETMSVSPDGEALFDFAA